MSDGVEIKTHDFEEAKNQLKKNLATRTKEIKLQPVATLSFFKVLDHKVSGAELNVKLSEIQDFFIAQNDTNRRTVNELGYVYNALESLDKDYIQGILVSIKATEKTSEQIKITQEQIKRIVEDHAKTLRLLNDFKNRLDSYAHLKDIDSLWKAWSQMLGVFNNGGVDRVEYSSDVQQTENNSLVSFSSFLSSVESSLKIQSTRLEALNEYVNKLKTMDIESDIGKMKENLSEIMANFQSIQKALSDQNSLINKAVEFVDFVSSFSHLKDVDSIWQQAIDLEKKFSDSQSQINGIKKQAIENKEEISNLKNRLSLINHLKDIDKLWESNDEHSSSIEEIVENYTKLKFVVSKNNESLKRKIDMLENSLIRKINISYFIGIFGIILFIVALVMIIIKS